MPKIKAFIGSKKNPKIKFKPQRCSAGTKEEAPNDLENAKFALR